MCSFSVGNEVYLLPSSYGQNRIWFFEQMVPNSATYHIPLLLKITGEIDPEILTRTLDKIRERHEILRTTFVEIEGELKQKVSLQLPSLVLEYKTMEEVEQEQPFPQFLEKFAWEPFDLEEGPLVKFQLIRVDPSVHYLLINIHHIIFDAWSLEVLKKELVDLYPLIEQGRADGYEELPLQYADYANWQKERLEGEALQKTLTFWRQHLEQVPSLLELPTDRPRPKEQSYAGDNVRFELPSSLVEPINAFCRAHQATHYTFFLAAFNVLLYRYTGQKDIVIGTPIANRTHPLTQDLIGFFVNTLPVRTYIKPYSSFSKILKTTIKSFLLTYENSEVPFEKLVRELKPERDSSYHPFFQALFTLHDDQEKETDAPFTIENEKIHTSTSKFDLVLYLACGKESISGEIEYSTDLFNRRTIERFQQHYITLISEILSHPQKPVSKLNILTKEEREQLESRNFLLAQMQPQFIHTLMTDQVPRLAEQIAVKGNEQSFTYAQLDQKSNQIAHELIARGIQPGNIVGVRLRRSPAQIAAILGVMKSGCVYMPIDTALPMERVQLMIEDSRSTAIITDDPLFHPWRETLTLLEPQEVFGRQRTDDPEITISLCPQEAIAYVIYTSGTTGRPKGVRISHGSLVNHILGFLQEFPFQPEEKVLQNISCSFDPAMTEIFCSLIAGGTLVITDHDKQFDIEYLAAMMRDEGITRAQLFHSLLEKLLDHPSFTANPHFRYLFTGGEPLPHKLVQKFYKNMESGAPLINLYGPTEACVAATFWRCDADHPHVITPIGNPFPHYQVLVLDENLQPVPRGVIGEMYIGGPGVGKGYVNNQGLSEKAFPLLEIAGGPERYYRTGDLVKQREAGEYLFVSRKDTQVKVRGFRIELDEILHIIGQQPEIKEAAVLVEEVYGDKKIFAFLVKKTGMPLTASELKKRLAKKLPHYMVPHVIKWMDQLPVSLNGKLDKSRLSFEGNDLASNEKIQPRTPFEQQLAAIWQEVLNVGAIGINEDFFDLGGHSIKVIEMAGLLRKRMNVRLAPSDLFLYRTVEALSEYLQAEGTREESGILVKLKEGRSDEPPLFLIHPGGGGTLCYVPLVRNIDRDIDMYGLQSQGYEKNLAPLADLKEMAALYVKEMQKIQPRGPYQMAGWSLGGTIAVEMARILEAEGESIRFLGLLDAHAFDRVALKKQHEDPLTVWAKSLSIDVKKFGERPHMEKCQIILEAAIHSKRLPQNAELEDVHRIINVMAANNLASDQYSFTTPIQTDLHLLVCRELDPATSHELVNAEKWRERTSGNVYTYSLPGHHNNLMSSPQVEQVGQKISEILKWG
ncbi:amino acid adenylation domain-containing protein [Brevibacillus ruminantium]|uniref:Amino acid adenylation domain-containing protein n=1 Tax=Brevibacillus ruminantium TaxID=2950604 RepID=A0ABY4WHI0_9BACL|nr:non-ribosomal peptide synthetase [Brevibacillus ruminantium]USG66582.1 amino acid adenylation domain-containing protein [Brevibacillus ruminantium]